MGQLCGKVATSGAEGRLYHLAEPPGSRQVQVNPPVVALSLI